MALTVEQQRILADYKKTHAKECAGLSDTQLISILSKNGIIKLTEVQENSLFLKDTQNYDDTGLVIEHQSNQKDIKTKVQDHQNTYLAKLNEQEKRLNKTKKEQGFLGKGWDWFKNTTGIGDSSDKAINQINAERELLEQVLSQRLTEEIKQKFKEVTGEDFSEENLERFKKGELSKVEEKINGYAEGQDMAADVAGDIISGIAAVGIYTAAVAAAPFTGGASIVAGVVAATASGAAIKAGVKALDTVGTEKEYTMKDLGHDCATGAFSGVLAPITGGLGGAVGKTVATKMGIQAVKQVGKEVAETGVKQGLKVALTNPAGYEYTGGKLVQRIVAYGAEMATDGALGGAVDGGFRAGLDNAWDGTAMLSGFVEGGIGGLVMAPAIGGGMKVAGKGAQKVFGKDNIHINAQNKRVRDDIVLDFMNGKIDENYAAAVLRDIDDFEQAVLVAEKQIKDEDKAKFAVAKDKISKKIDENIKDHGSIVMQSRIKPERIKKDPKTGIEYIEATRDDIMLVASVPKENTEQYIEGLINAKEPYVSLSLINKNSEVFYKNSEYGVIVNNRSTSVTSAGFGQVSKYEKTFNTFVEQNSLTISNGNQEYLFLKNYTLAKLKKEGIELSETEYVELFKKLSNKQYFDEITDDITINGKCIKAELLQETVEESHVELAAKVYSGEGSNNEVTSIIDGVNEIYARVDNIDDVKPEIKELAKKYGLKIRLLGKIKDFSIKTNPEYLKELDIIQQQFKDKTINVQQMSNQKYELKNKYENMMQQDLKGRTTKMISESK